MSDRETGEAINVNAKGVVNAAGPFVDGLRQMDDSEGAII